MRCWLLVLEVFRITATCLGGKEFRWTWHFISTHPSGHSFVPSLSRLWPQLSLSLPLLIIFLLIYCFMGRNVSSLYLLFLSP